ncbi:MAG TPA: helix-turn-helix domain-containing protein [Pyrinomonadaceae bacterium]|nr:helix-turn-helix domain-containing protein [Pyrinomonadaceae bacterium]
MRRVIFLILPDLEILDLAGPLQALHEANRCGADYDIQLCGPVSEPRTDQGLRLAGLQPLPEVAGGDLVFVPGIRLASLGGVNRGVLDWLRTAHKMGAHLCSVCTGAFVLGQAGLLDGRQCTTHWTRTEELQKCYPRAKVLTNRLFVEDGPVTTSAGIAAGIDLALSVVERMHGPRLTAAVAREMVIYLRRDGTHQQESVYLEYRAHIHRGVHRAQDLLTSEPERRLKLGELARAAHMSERSLTRAFRRATGISVGEYVAKLRLELAKSLMADPQLSLEAVAARSGFDSARQLRRTCKKVLGVPPSSFRRK